jgi:Amt family ammonium transporter
MSINPGDTAWMLVSAAMVLFMTPGLAFFYGGLVRRKNFLSTIMMSFACLGLVSVLWAVYGYSLVFGPDKAGIIGGLNFFAASDKRPLRFMQPRSRNWHLWPSRECSPSSLSL